MYEVEYTDEFEGWWESLSEEEQISIAASVGLLERIGPQLKYPHSSGIEGSKYEKMVPLADKLYEAHLSEISKL